MTSSMQIRRGILSLSLLLLMGCEAETVPGSNEASAAMPIPAASCRKVKAGLDQLKDGAALIYTDAGEATIEQTAWLQLEQAGREQLEQLLALHKACNSKTPAREQEIVIRNENGLVVTQRYVETQADTSSLFRD